MSGSFSASAEDGIASRVTKGQTAEKGVDVR
jgi:hypothetical protein